IRYSTENALSQHYSAQEILAHILRPRILLYSSILLVITLASAWSLATRIPLKVDVIRDRAMLAREADDGRIENIFHVKVMNVSEVAGRFTLTVSGLEGAEIVGEREVEVASAENKEVVVSVRVPPENGRKGANPLFFDVAAVGRDGVAVHEKASFLMP
ncbi:MAG TPA: FixG Ig-like domain-containing protein, partial [Rhodocyclaceae bacterium]|nr:FixG Ig-like domain-containing protein [Rhodocyclaceae bacterium]